MPCLCVDLSLAMPCLCVDLSLAVPCLCVDLSCCALSVCWPIPCRALSVCWPIPCRALLQAVAQQLCENQLGEAGSPLRVQPDQDLGVQSLVCVLTHLRLALRPGANGSHLLNPLSALVFQPANMAVLILNFALAQSVCLMHTNSNQIKLWPPVRGHQYLLASKGATAVKERGRAKFRHYGQTGTVHCCCFLILVCRRLDIVTYNKTLMHNMLLMTWACI